MDQKPVLYKKLFEVRDVLGKKIRTTKTYWRKIKQAKHRELRYGVSAVIQALTQPDEVRQSVADETVYLYAKKMTKDGILMVVAKILDSEGFVITVYQTKKHKAKGKLLWQHKNA